MPNLERLGLTDLTALSDALNALIDTGKVRALHGLDPVFDLSPGQSPMIHVPGFTMPHAWTADEAAATPPARDDAPYAWSPATGIVPIGEGPGDIPSFLKDVAPLPDLLHFASPPPPEPAADDAFPVAAPYATGSLAEPFAGGSMTFATGPDPDHPLITIHEPAASPPPEVAAAAPEVQATSIFAADAREPKWEAGTGDTPEPSGAAPSEPAPADPAPPEQTAPPEGAGAAADPAAVGGAGVKAAPPAAQPVFVPAQNYGTAGPPWTPEQDTQLIDLVVARVLAGETKAKAIAEVAAQLGRPIEGSKFRLANKLRGRFDTALQSAARAAWENKPIGEAAKPIPAGPSAAPAPKAASEGPEIREQVAAQDLPSTAPVTGGATFMAALSTLDRALWSHLTAHPPRWPLTHAIDLEIAERLAAGEKPHAIALDIGIDTNLVTSRFATLSATSGDAKNRVTIDGQARLLKLLRVLADPARTNLQAAE